MAKKLVKVEVKEDKKLQPNTILLSDGEILSATCDIYKFNLSKKNKLGQLVARSLGSAGDADGFNESDFDFCLLRVKDSLIEILKKKEITLLYYSDETNGAEKIEDYAEFLDYLDDYISKIRGELLFERYNKKDLVYFIPYLDDVLAGLIVNY